MEKYARQQCDFIEWIMFRKDHGTIVIGTMSDQIRVKLRRFNRPHDD